MCFFFQAEDGIRDRDVTEFRRVLFRSRGARAVIALHQDANQVAAVLRLEPTRRRADTALEAVADHSGPAPDTALDDGPAARAAHRGPGVLLGDVEAADVVQPAVPRLGDYRERPVVLAHAALAYRPCDHRVANDPARVPRRA